MTQATLANSEPNLTQKPWCFYILGSRFYAQDCCSRLVCPKTIHFLVALWLFTRTLFSLEAMFGNRSNVVALEERLTRLEDNYMTNIPRVATLESRFNMVDKHLLSLESRLDKHVKAMRYNEDFVPQNVTTITAELADGAVRT